MRGAADQAQGKGLAVNLQAQQTVISHRKQNRKKIKGKLFHCSRIAVL